MLLSSRKLSSRHGPESVSERAAKPLYAPVTTPPVHRRHRDSLLSYFSPINQQRAQEPSIRECLSRQQHDAAPHTSPLRGCQQRHRRCLLTCLCAEMHEALPEGWLYRTGPGIGKLANTSPFLLLSMAEASSGDLSTRVVGGQGRHGDLRAGVDGGVDGHRSAVA